MRRVSLSRKVIVSAALVAVVVGLIGGNLWPRAARAQMAGSSTVFVPSEGLVFRTLDGKAIARLSRGKFGGVLELYDDNEEPTLRFSGSVPTPAPMSTPAPLANPSVSHGCPVLSLEDPFGDRL